MKYCFWILILFLISCDRDIPFDGFGKSPEPVVQGYFTEDSIFRVRLSKTGDIMDNPGIYGMEDLAQVFVTDSVGKVFVMKNVGNGWYNSDSLPQSGMNYLLEARLPDGKTVFASDFIPKDVLRASVDTSTGPQGRLDIKIEISDPVQTENRYILRIAEKSYHYIINPTTLRTDTVLDWHPLPYAGSHKFFSTSNPSGRNLTGFEIFEDEFFDGQDFEFEVFIEREYLNQQPFKGPSDSLMVVLKSVNEPTYQYYLAVIKNSRNYGGPFSTNFNPPDNIQNGHGLFYGYRQYIKRIQLKWPGYFLEMKSHKTLTQLIPGYIFREIPGVLYLSFLCLRLELIG